MQTLPPEGVAVSTPPRFTDDDREELRALLLLSDASGCGDADALSLAQTHLARIRAERADRIEREEASDLLDFLLHQID